MINFDKLYELGDDRMKSKSKGFLTMPSMKAYEVL